MRTIKALSATLFLTMTIVMQSCIKPAHEEKFGPLDPKSCSDGNLNQGEYFTDCGGPCAPCGINTFVNYMVVDSTWSFPNGADIQVNSNWDTAVFDGDIIYISAIEAILGININFSIDKSWRGVHAIDSFAVSDGYSGPGFIVGFETGVVTITNVDEVNGYISGEFSFNCIPSEETANYGSRISILEGVFRDIPTIEGL